MLKIRLICATRQTQADFYSQAALGQSFRCYKSYQKALPFRVIVELSLFDSNTRGLAAVYNEAIAVAAHDPAILVFVHDDVYLGDFFWMEELAQAISMFDVVGIVGNKRRLPRQTSWCFISDQFAWDDESNLSGTIGQGRGFPCHLSFFGPAPQACKVLDGVFLAVDSAVLHRTGLRFDERFTFDFYDMDFCRQAEKLGLTLGTWPIAITHESIGELGTPRWREAYQVYIDKYAVEDEAEKSRLSF